MSKETSSDFSEPGSMKSSMVVETKSPTMAEDQVDDKEKASSAILATSDDGKKVFLYHVADVQLLNSLKNSITEESEIVDDEKQKVSLEYINGSCKGDPRMNKAVYAKHADPSLSLLDALLLGGFKFPEYNKSIKNGMNEQDICDENGITMRQRKNQLGRRLRSLRCQEENAKKKKNHDRYQQGTSIDRSNSLDLSRSLGEAATQNHLLGENDGLNQIPGLFSSTENGLLQQAFVSSSSSTSSTVNQQILYQQGNLPSTLNLLARLHSTHFTLLRHPEAFSSSTQNQLVYSQPVPSSQDLSNALLSLEQISSYLRNPCPRPNLLLKNEYIHSLAQGHQRQDLFNQEEIQKILASAHPPTSNAVIANDLVHQLRSAFDSATENVNAGYKQKMVSIVEDDTFIEHKEKKRTNTHCASPQTKATKKHKKNKTNHDIEVTLNSSPRLMNAIKTFHEKFDAFTHSCMKEAGYTKDESLELIETFQKKVIGEAIKEKK
ncbi:hypothetical protein CTEN210_18199 [Chaetoceros tenuissimus]|uniref:Uncharacterized protein n=1 Tax=Chaetoceros tenuissimus TaxID=426638 RepID=A0AAD3DC76_9STRA|nr:hypothetical protein CTEN210_18199 [Chaetoceros tenuissimus]